ncbi:MAG: iron-sulfur cluster insertion protein ErpA [Armatimonadetes bacterium]|nr:iron-sulfur cluster insertion protein ErpA [Armatimonadota bacterium]
MAQREEVLTPEITLTEKAASEIKDLLQEQGKPEAGLRVWVAGGGCSGLQYGMAIDDGEAEEGDRILEHLGVKVLVDPASLSYMAGSVVDYVDDVLGGGFKIENPQATRSCGCGSSFATEEGEAGTSGGGCGSCGNQG